MFNIYINILFGINVKDSQCGCKIFKKEVVDKVVDEIKSKGYEFDVELLWKIKKKGFKIREEGIEWGHQEESKFSLGNGPKMLVSLLRLRFKRHEHTKD